MGTVRDFIFGCSKITTGGDCSHEIKRCMLLGRKAMTNLSSWIKSRDITLLTKLHLVKAIVFPVVMYGCEKVKVKSLSRVWLCDLVDCSLPGFSVHGILQARILEGYHWSIKERWVLKNWCFWTVVLEKNLESPLVFMKIQPVHPKGNQSWIFIGRTDAEAETQILWPPDAKD